MLLTIIGTGYVGLTTAVVMAYIGCQVIAVDKDLSKLEMLSKDKSPIYEPGIELLLKEAKKNIVFTSNSYEAIGKADIIIIAVGTPAMSNGRADTNYVEKAALEIAQSMLEGRKYTLVIKSTVPIGTGRRVALVVNRELAKRGITVSVHFASNPEFLREGMALSDALYPDRIVVGAEQLDATEALRRLYRPILEQTFIPPPFLPRPEGYRLPPLLTTDPTSSEMIKYAANAFLAIKISYINEIAGLCEKVGADITEVARGIGLDPRIGGRFLQAGLGWGGSCFPKDTSALIALGSEYSYNMSIVKASCEVNQLQRQLIIQKLQLELRVLRGRTIGVLGLAFKPNTDDVRESPALYIIKELIDLGAHVKVHDPIALTNAQKLLENMDVEYTTDPYGLAKDCDALILATEWEDYRQLDYMYLAKCLRTPILIDARNFLKPEEVRRANIRYLGVGR